VEEQQEISAPLAGDIASTMFDGSQEPIRRHRRLSTADGRAVHHSEAQSIHIPKAAPDLIDSKLIAVSPDDIVRTGQPPGHNAKTRFNAESWETDVSSTMEKIWNSTSSEYLEPEVIVEPGGNSRSG
jgi:hypothetical protein